MTHACNKCGAHVIRVTHAAGSAQRTLDLEPGGSVDAYIGLDAIDGESMYPADGSRVFLSLGTIEHRHVCPAAWRKRLARPTSSQRAKASPATTKE